MDEQVSNLNPNDSLPEEDKAYRIVVQTQRKDAEKFLPSTSSFSLSKNDIAEGYKLSVDWNKMTSPAESIARVGCSYKGETKEYKQYENREIYALDVSFLKSLSQVNDVIYNPIYNNPPIHGKPNNKAHSLICFNPEDYDENTPYLLTQLRNHAKEQKINVDMEKVGLLVKAYKDSINKAE